MNVTVDPGRILLEKQKSRTPSRGFDEATLGSPAFRLGSATFCPYLTVGLVLIDSPMYAQNKKLSTKYLCQLFE